MPHCRYRLCNLWQTLFVLGKLLLSLYTSLYMLYETFTNIVYFSVIQIGSLLRQQHELIGRNMSQIKVISRLVYLRQRHMNTRKTTGCHCGSTLCLACWWMIASSTSIQCLLTVRTVNHFAPCSTLPFSISPLHGEVITVSVLLHYGTRVEMIHRCNPTHSSITSCLTMKRVIHLMDAFERPRWSSSRNRSESVVHSILTEAQTTAIPMWPTMLFRLMAW